MHRVDVYFGTTTTGETLDLSLIDDGSLYVAGGKFYQKYSEQALDADGNFTKPALGFMKSKGLKEEDVVFKTVGKDEYIFGTIRQEGKETSEVLKTILPEAVKNVTFPKAMRWGGRNMRFARPIRWMVTLLNDNVLEIDLEGIKSSNITAILPFTSFAI